MCAGPVMRGLMGMYWGGSMLAVVAQFSFAGGVLQVGSRLAFIWDLVDARVLLRCC